MKLKFMFKIEDQEKAYELYQTLSSRKNFEETGDPVQIYYLKPEDLFVKYADEEAEKWHADQKKYEEEMKAKQEEKRK